MAVLMLALVLASCGKSDVPSGMKRVESDFIEYEFFVPTAWNVDVSNGFAGIIASALMERVRVICQRLVPLS